MIKTHSQMHHNTQSNAPQRLVLTTQLNHLASLAKWLSVYELSGCGFDSRCENQQKLLFAVPSFLFQKTSNSMIA